MVGSNRKLIVLDARTKHSDLVQFLKNLINDIEKGKYPDLEQIAVALACKVNGGGMVCTYDSNGLRHAELFSLFESAQQALLHGEEYGDVE